MSERVVYLNGVWVAERDARISIFDAGLMYGEMAFEMTRTFQQRPFRLRVHLNRLMETLAFLGIPSPVTIDELEALTGETLARNLPTESSEVDWHIRHDISRGPVELYSTVFPEGLRPTLAISCWPLVKTMGKFAPLYETGVPLLISPQRSIPPELIDPRAKTRSRVHFQLAQHEAQRRLPGSWPVLVDEQGFLTEGPSWNLFIVKDGVIYSPRGEEILHGVSREITLECAKELGIPAEDAGIDREMALSADEIFCTATSFGIVHAASMEGKTVTKGPGPVLRRLLPEWKKRVGVDFVAQARRYAELLPAWEQKERKSQESK
ncbi:MAG: aminotransferase class IV [Planctomycetales bacterium]